MKRPDVSRRGWGRTALAASVVLAVSVAAVPLYGWLSRTGGFATPDGASGSVLDRTMTVRFDSATDAGMPWRFKPMQDKMTLHVGQTALAFYEAYNPTDRAIAGKASYRVLPDLADRHVVRVDCFCFTQQVLQPHERVQMPITFYIDPGIAEDAAARKTSRITLSYTFHEIPLPADQVEALAEPAKTPVN